MVAAEGEAGEGQAGGGDQRRRQLLQPVDRQVELSEACWGGEAEGQVGKLARLKETEAGQDG